MHNSSIVYSKFSQPHVFTCKKHHPNPECATSKQLLTGKISTDAEKSAEPGYRSVDTLTGPCWAHFPPLSGWDSPQKEQVLMFIPVDINTP